MGKYEETTNGDLRRTFPATRTIVDHGCARKNGGRRGAGFRAEKWDGRFWCELRDADAKFRGRRQLEIVNHPVHGECLEGEFLRRTKGRDRAEWHRFRDGSTEWEIVWSSTDDVPEYVDFLIDAPDGLAWAKQPELTPEEVDDGCVRPENVVNSYAVYGPTSGRYIRVDGSEVVNYETGKLMHVYRPWLEDSAGNRAWLDQTAPLGTPPRLRVAIPLEIVAAMTPPITCGPNFGYETIGASSASLTTGRMLGCGSYSPAASGNATSISAYLTNTGSVNCTWGLYSDDAGAPKSLLRDTAAYTGIPSSSWVTLDLDSPLAVTAAAQYWLALYYGNALVIKQDARDPGKRRYSASGVVYVGGTCPSEFPGPPLSATKYEVSCYSTYTEPAAGKPWLGAIRPATILGGGLA